MVTVDQGDMVSPVSGPYRFDKDPDWAERAIRPFKAVIRGRVRITDHDKERVRRAVLTPDAKGAALAAAILNEKSVSMATVQQAISHGIAAVENPHPALAALFDEIETPPTW